MTDEQLIEAAFRAGRKARLQASSLTTTDEYFEPTDGERIFVRVVIAAARAQWEQRIRAEIMDCGFRMAELKNEQGWWVKDDQFKLLNRIQALQWVLAEPKPTKETTDEH